VIQVAEPFFVDVLNNPVCLHLFNWQCDNANERDVKQLEEGFSV